MGETLTPERLAELRAAADGAAAKGQTIHMHDPTDLSALLDAADECDRLRAELAAQKAVWQEFAEAAIALEPHVATGRNAPVEALLDKVKEVARLRSELAAAEDRIADVVAEAMSFRPGSRKHPRPAGKLGQVIDRIDARGREFDGIEHDAARCEAAERELAAVVRKAEHGCYGHPCGVCDPAGDDAPGGR